MARKRRITIDKKTREQESSSAGEQRQESIEKRERGAERSTRSKRSRRKSAGSMKWAGLGLLFVVALLLFFLPTIIAVTPLRQMVVDRALQDFQGRVVVQSATLSWFSPIQLTGISATDSRGENLFSAQSVASSKSLLSLLNGKDYGKFEIVKPVVHLHLRQDGSNLEDAIATWLEPTETSESSPPVEIVVREGTAHISSELDAQAWQLSELTGNASLFQAASPLALKLEGIAANSAAPSGGTFQVQAVFDEGERQLGFSNGQVTMVGTRLPIDVASPFMTRYVEPMQFAGVLDGDLEVSWQAGGASAHLRSQAAKIESFYCRAPHRIGHDQIQLAQVELRGEAQLDAQAIQANELICHSEVGSLRANGQLHWEQLQQGWTATGDTSSDFQAEGHLDLAKLARLLPETISLQQGLEVEAGELKLTAASRKEGASQRLVVNLESVGLSAVRHGQRLHWHQPIRVVAAVRQNAQGVVLESLNGQTNFVSLQGQGTFQQGEFVIQGDLAKASTELEQFIDLGGVQVEGLINGRLIWKTDLQTSSTARPLTLQGQFDIERPRLIRPGKAPWQPSQLRVAVQGNGIWQTEQGLAQHVHLQTGGLQLVAGQEQLDVQLAEPLDNLSWQTPWKLNCSLAGSLQQWLAHVGTVVPVEFQAQGALRANAYVIASRDEVRVHSLSYECQSFVFDGYGTNIQEPVVQGQGSLAYQRATGKLQVDELTIVSSALSARGQQVQWDQSQERFSGEVAFRADINRTLPWWIDPPTEDSVHWYGMAQGNIQWGNQDEFSPSGANASNGTAPSNSVIQGRVQVQVDDLIAAKPVRHTPSTGVQTAGHQNGWVKLFEEKQATLESILHLDLAANRVQFQQVALNSSAANLNASGSLSDWGGEMMADIQGSWAPQWHYWQPLLQAYAGDAVVLQGVSGGPFQLKGPLRDVTSSSWLSPYLEGQAQVAWQQGQLLGLDVGGSQLQLTARQGMAELRTDAIAVAGGTVSLAPRIDLRTDSPVLELPPGRVVEQVQLTPEICRGWLKYVAPTFADATALQGQFSVDTSQASWSFQNAAASQVAGTLTFHGGYVGPGPLGTQLLSLAKQVKALAKGEALQALGNSGQNDSVWMTLPEQQVPFQMQQGRVYHDGLQFQVDGVTIQTRGSVGLDQSLQLIAMIPIAEEWVADQRWLASLRGQTLQIPITGTVSQPRIDNSALTQLSQQLLQQAAGNAFQDVIQDQWQEKTNDLFDKANQKLGDELLKGINGLFGPNK